MHAIVPLSPPDFTFSSLTFPHSPARKWSRPRSLRARRSLKSNGQQMEMEMDRRTVGVHTYVGQRIRQTENNSVAEVLQIGIWDRRSGGGGILEIEWKGLQTARRTGVDAQSFREEERRRRRDLNSNLLPPSLSPPLEERKGRKNVWAAGAGWAYIKKKCIIAVLLVVAFLIPSPH